MSYPHLVVAVVCIKDNQVLMVNEIDNGINCWNQPAGHVEVGESIEAAAIREALEETGYQVTLTGIQGIYQSVHRDTGIHYVRFCFTALAQTKITETLDPDILQARWLDIDELLADKYVLRSPITRQTLEDLRSGPIVPMAVLNEFNSGVPK